MAPMLAARISVHSSHEAAAPVARRGLALGRMAAPAVPSGEPLTGQVVLLGPPHGKVAALSLRLHTFASLGSPGASEWEQALLHRADAVLFPPPGPEPHSLDADGSLTLSFRIDGGPPPLDSFGIDAEACVAHELALTLRDGRVERTCATQPLYVYVRTPDIAGAGQWLTIGDFGGECRLDLHRDPAVPWAVGGAIEGTLRVEGTDPLREVRLVLQTSVNGAAARRVREETVWAAPAGGELRGCREVRLALGGDGAALPPSLSPRRCDGLAAPLSVEHSLRLEVLAADGRSGWNTLRVRLAHGAAPAGVPSGKLPPLEPLDDSLPCPPPHRPLRARLRRLRAAAPLGVVGLVVFAAALDTLLRIDRGETPLVVRGALRLEEASGVALGVRSSWGGTVELPPPWLLSRLTSRRAAELGECGGGEAPHDWSQPSSSWNPTTAGFEPLSVPDARPPTPLPPPPPLDEAAAKEVVAKIDLDQTADNLENMSDAQVRELVMRLGLTYDEEEMDMLDVRDMVLAALSRKIEEAKQSAEPKSAQEILKGKSIVRLKDMFDDCGIPYDEKASVRELRAFALAIDLLGKHEALDPVVKLERGRERAILRARAADEKEARRKEKAREEKQARDDAETREKGVLHDHPLLNKKPYWEREWDSETEREVYARLSQLPLWDVLTPAQLERLVDRIRENPDSLEPLEAEMRAMSTIKNMMADFQGEMPSIEQMREAGIPMEKRHAA